MSTIPAESPRRLTERTTALPRLRTPYIMQLPVRTMVAAIVVVWAGTPALAEPCAQGKNGLPEIQLYESRRAETLLQASGLTAAQIRQAVSAGLAEEHVGCISDHAITYPEKMEDWVSVAITAAGKAAPPLVLEISVRNGLAVSNQIVRWRERRPVGAAPKDFHAALAATLKDLAAAYGSPQYRRGRGPE